MVWLLGLSAVVLTADTTRMARPAWLALASMLLTTALFRSPAAILIRDLLLLAAAIDASTAMVTLLRARDLHPPSGARAGSPSPPGSVLPGQAGALRSSGRARRGLAFLHGDDEG